MEKLQKEEGDYDFASLNNDAEILIAHVFQCPQIRPNSFTSKMVISSVMRLSQVQKKNASSDKPDRSSHLSILKCEDMPRNNELSRSILLYKLFPRRKLEQEQDLNHICNRFKSVINHESNLSKKEANFSFLPSAILIFIGTLSLGLFTIYLTVTGINISFKEYVTPMIETARWTDSSRLKDEYTYYDRRCDISDISTRFMEDLILSETESGSTAVEKMMIHGAILIPSILEEDTASTLRNYILKRNMELTADEKIPLDGPDQRWSFGIGANENSAVSKAVQEVGANGRFRRTIQKILGPDPAVVEITAITTAYGAEHQGWHPDVKPEGSSVKYSRTFTHSYSLFIPLQNTTAKMGATELCPGTHFCANEMEDVCETGGFQAAGDEESNLWRIGDGLLLNQCLWHRGFAHTDPNSKERVVFIISFISRPQPGIDHRQLSHGTYFHIRPDMYGHTLNDLREAPIRMAAPFTYLRSLGVWKPQQANWGWDFVTTTSLRISNGENGYQHEDLVHFVQEHKIGKAIPSFLLGDVTEEGGWVLFIEGTLSRVKDFSIILYITSLASFGLLFNLAAFNRTSRLLTLFWILFVTAIFHFIILSISRSLMGKLHTSTWAKCISSGSMFARPFQTFHRNDDSTARSPTTIPNKKDCLFSERFDFEPLWAYSDFLNYHPGNVKWLNFVKSIGSNNYRNMPYNLQHQFLKQSIMYMKENGGRFLKQNDFGQWEILSDAQIMIEVERSILLNVYEISLLLSQNTLSRTRNSIALSRISTENLTRWRKSILRLEHIHHTTSNANIQRKTKKYIGISSFMTLRKQTDELNTKSTQSLFHSITLRRKDLSQFFIGDGVEAYYADLNKWVGAVVIDVIKNNYYLLQYVDGFIETLRFEFLRPYLPYTEGDLIEKYWSDCDSCPLKFSMCKILKVYPDHSYDLYALSDGILYTKIYDDQIVRSN